MVDKYQEALKDARQNTFKKNQQIIKNNNQQEEEKKKNHTQDFHGNPERGSNAASTERPNPGLVDYSTISDSQNIGMSGKNRKNMREKYGYVDGSQQNEEGAQNKANARPSPTPAGSFRKRDEQDTASTTPRPTPGSFRKRDEQDTASARPNPFNTTPKPPGTF